MTIEKNSSSVFIGSSAEAIDIAREIELQLNTYANTILWTHSFQPSEHPIEALLRNAKQCNFAILVITPDDFVKSRNEEFLSPRDNILFELGLFMNQLGKERTFIICEEQANLKMPSDLLGVTTIKFRLRENLSTSLSPACTIMIKRIKNLEKYEQKEIFIEKILEQFKEGILMTSWNEIYERAIKLVSKAENRIRVTSFGDYKWQGNNKYLECIAKVAKKQKELRNDFIHKVVYGQNKADPISIERNIISRKTIFEEFEVLDLLQVRKVEQVWGVDFLIVDDRHAHMSFHRAIGHSLFLGIEFADCPKLVRPLSQWYDESIFSRATPLNIDNLGQ